MKFWKRTQGLALATLGAAIGGASVWDLANKAFDPTDVGYLVIGFACVIGGAIAFVRAGADR